MAQGYDDSFFGTFDRLTDNDKLNLLENIPKQNADQLLSDYRGWKEANLKTPTKPSTPTQPSSGGSALLGGIGAAAANSLASESAPAAPKIVSGIHTGGNATSTGLSPGAAAITDAPFFDKGGALQGTLGQTGAGLLGGAGLLAGGKGVYDAYKSGSPLSGAISGAGVGAGGLALAGALGASTGGLALPILAGGALLGGGAGLFGDRKTFSEQAQDRLNALGDRGVQVSNPGRYTDNFGLSKSDLVNRETDNLSRSEWGNPVFAQSRNEADLKPEDVWGGLPMYEVYGNSWDAMTPQERWEASQAMLDNGLIKEAKGQLWIDDKEAAKQVGDAAISGELALSTPYEEGWFANNVDIQQAVPTEEVSEASFSSEPKQKRPQRPKPLNNIPEIIKETAPPLIEPPVPQPTLKSPSDYAAAYVNVFNMNQGLASNPNLTGRY